MTELDTLFRKLYEDNALGRLTDERFVFLTSGYEDEKKSLAARIDELQQQIATVTERKGIYQGLFRLSGNTAIYRN